MKIRALIIDTSGLVSHSMDMMGFDFDGSDSEINMFLDKVGLFQQLNQDFEVHCSFPFGKHGIDSSEIYSKHWMSIASKIQLEYVDYHCFVVLHGTDTMAYTASALSFLFKNLTKPVILTGSVIPMHYENTDAIRNISNSIRLADYINGKIPKISEVVICFGNKIFRGNRTTKYGQDPYIPFESPNFPILGTIDTDIHIKSELLICGEHTGDTLTLNSIKLDSSFVYFCMVSPGNFYDRYMLVEDDKKKGILISVYGEGTGQYNRKFLSDIKEAVERGKIVMCVSQSVEGALDIGGVNDWSNFIEIGAMSAFDMTMEAATTKMLLAINAPHKDTTDKYLQLNQKGEQSANIICLRYSNIQPKVAKTTVETSATSLVKISSGAISRIVLKVYNLGVINFDLYEKFNLSISIEVHQKNAESQSAGLIRIPLRWKGEPQSFNIDITSEARMELNPKESVILRIKSDSKKAKIYYESIILVYFTIPFITT